MANAQNQTLQGDDWNGVNIGGSLEVSLSRASFNTFTSDGFEGSYFTPPYPEQILSEADKSYSQ